MYVKELEKFLTMKVLDNTPAVLSLGKLCDENGCSIEWINGQKPHLIKDGIRIICNTENFVPIVVPGLTSSSSGSSSTSRTPLKQESHSSSSSSTSSSSPTVSEKFRLEKGKMYLTMTSLQCQCLSWSATLCYRNKLFLLHHMPLVHWFFLSFRRFCACVQFVADIVPTDAAQN